MQIAAGKSWNIDCTKSNDDKSLVNGVMLSDGDATVPLVSLGYLCASGWRKPEMNPSGVKVGALIRHAGMYWSHGASCTRSCR